MDSLTKKFMKSLEEVAAILGMSPTNVSRDLYVRTSVDYDIKDRLSGAKLHEMGGFAFSKEKIYGPVNTAPKILVFDIETAPMEVYSWGLFDLKLSPDQIIKDWAVLSVAAKWLGEPEVFYADTSKRKDPRDDKQVLEYIWKLLDEADVVITHNGIKFDSKKLNARFISQGFKPPSSYRHIDTYQTARRKFGFTSAKLSHLTKTLNKEGAQKLEHAKFPGFSLWKACLEGNKEAWKEMQEYNIMDVISLEELAKKLMPWDNKINWSLYSNTNHCACGSTNLEPVGYYYTNASRFVKFRCQECGAEYRDKRAKKNNVTIRNLRV